MTSKRLAWLVLLISFFLTLAPPGLYAQDYLLFVSTASDTRGLVYTMDSEGHLALRETITVGADAHNVEVSPDGRTVVFSTDREVSNTLAMVNIKRDGSLVIPVYQYDQAHNYLSKQFVFHDSIPLLYIHNSPSINIWNYDGDQHQLKNVGQILPSFDSGMIMYSVWANSLIMGRYIDTKQEQIGLGTLRLSADGLTAQEGPTLPLPWRTISCITVSLNGPWVAAVGTNRGMPNEDYNELALVRVGSDGTLSLAHQIDFTQREAADMNASLSFSPDGHRLYMLSAQGGQTLISYTLDEDKGELTQRDAISWTQMPQAYAGTLGLTISPDGRFAAFRSINDQQIGHNWINVVRLCEDGTIQYLLDKRIDVPQYLGDLAFAPYPKQNATAPQWALYE